MKSNQQLETVSLELLKALRECVRQMEINMPQKNWNFVSAIERAKVAEKNAASILEPEKQT